MNIAKKTEVGSIQFAIFIMAPLWNRAGHYIFALWFLSSFFLLFFLAKSQQSQIRCLPYFYTWCGLSANLECRSEMCYTLITGNAGRKNCQKLPKIRHLGTISCLCQALSLQLRHVLIIGENLLNSRISSTCSCNW